MEKLIELLRESFPLDYDYVENDWHICHWYTDETGEYNMYWNIDSEIISKKFWFIKWLIDNDKVDRNFIDYAEIHETKRELESNYQPEDIERQYYEKLLMLLSIQDNPIEFLIGILK